MSVGERAATRAAASSIVELPAYLHDGADVRRRDREASLRGGRPIAEQLHCGRPQGILGDGRKPRLGQRQGRDRPHHLAADAQALAARRQNPQIAGRLEQS
jgi:hypothetical protein